MQYKYENQNPFPVIVPNPRGGHLTLAPGQSSTNEWYGRFCGPRNLTRVPVGGKPGVTTTGPLPARTPVKPVRAEKQAVEERTKYWTKKGGIYYCHECDLFRTGSRLAMENHLTQFHQVPKEDLLLPVAQPEKPKAAPVAEAPVVAPVAQPVKPAVEKPRPEPRPTETPILDTIEAASEGDTTDWILHDGIYTCKRCEVFRTSDQNTMVAHLLHCHLTTPAEAPVETPVETPVEIPTEVSVETPAETPAAPVEEAPAESFTCAVCGKAYKSKAGLLNHQKKHE